MTLCLFDPIIKACIECGASKPLDKFYCHPARADGTVNVCKECHKARMKRRRLANPRVQEYDRIRYQQPERKAAVRTRAEQWKDEHPVAYKAHCATSNAIRDRHL